MHLTETGLIKFWMHHSYKPSACLKKTSSSQAKISPIQLADLTSAFFILGIGLSLSTLAFLLELFRQNFKKAQGDHKNNFVVC